MLTIHLLSLWAGSVSHITPYRPYLSLEQYPISGSLERAIEHHGKPFGPTLIYHNQVKTV
jgi:hypothetical protein